MADYLNAAGFRFLFRDDRGQIDRRTWWYAVGVLAFLALLAVIALRFANPHGDITRVALTGGFVFACMFLAVCYYFVSAKRFTDRSRPEGLALLLPAAIFLAAALHWLQPSLRVFFPDWLGYIADLLVLAIALWNIVELGCLPARDGVKA
jgi:uncharacterized membrane protein YhaH (DUF805 family)